MAGGGSIISLCTLGDGELKMFPSLTSDVANSPLMMQSCTRVVHSSRVKVRASYFVCVVWCVTNTSSLMCASKVKFFFLVNVGSRN